MISRKSEPVEVLIVRALDEFAIIHEYHKLLDMAAASEESDKSELLLNCYRTLAEPHREELQLTLTALIAHISKSS